MNHRAVWLAIVAGIVIGMALSGGVNVSTTDIVIVNDAHVMLVIPEEAINMVEEKTNVTL
jgi:hypothetical protein